MLYHRRYHGVQDILSIPRLALERTCLLVFCDARKLDSMSNWITSLNAPPPGSLYQLNAIRKVVHSSLYGLVCIMAISNFLKHVRCRGWSLCDT